MLNRSLWAITSYFNPCGYKRRLENYKIFHKNLPLPLVTVELSYNGKFQLNDSDADILIQLNGKDIIWQKERLLNIGLQHLPETCDSVAWLDCDIVFPDKSWVYDAIAKLKEYKIIQLCQKVYHLTADIKMEDSLTGKLQKYHDTLLSEYSFAFIQNDDTELQEAPEIRDSSFSHLPAKGCPGVCWTIRKEILLEHGFYDACIAGGGDKAITYAAAGRMHGLPENRPMNSHQLKHYLAWAIPFSASIKKSISFLDQDIYHLWHGNFENRSYYERHEILRKYEFDPFTDITLDDNDCWKWNSNKPALHQDVEAYFISRKEDGDVTG